MNRKVKKEKNKKKEKRKNERVSEGDEVMREDRKCKRARTKKDERGR